MPSEQLFSYIMSRTNYISTIMSALH